MIFIDRITEFFESSLSIYKKLYKLTPGQLWQAGEGAGGLLLGALQVVLVVRGPQVPRVAVAGHQVVEMGGGNVEGPPEDGKILQFRQAKSANGGSILSSSQFLILLQLPSKMKHASKVVKVDSKIIISLPQI
jgi:hypothetical protein